MHTALAGRRARYTAGSHAVEATAVDLSVRTADQHNEAAFGKLGWQHDPSPLDARSAWLPVANDEGKPGGCPLIIEKWALLFLLFYSAEG